MMRKVVLVTLVALAGCNSGSQAPAPTPTGTTVAEQTSPPTSAGSVSPSPTAPALTPTPQATQDLAVLENRDCRTVAMAYVEAVARNDFDFAARVWNDPVIDAARLKARFAGYAVPQIEIKKVSQEGAAGSLYCTVTGVLTDTADPNKASRPGEIVLKRVNDVPGATPDQLRWTIRSSTFIEKMERSSKSGAT